MINLSFSPENFETIFDIECRKRNMREFMPKSYSDAIDLIRLHQKELIKLKDYRLPIDPVHAVLVERRKVSLPGIIQDDIKLKESIVANTLRNYSRIINAKSFKVDLYEVDRSEGIYSLLKPKLLGEKLRMPPEVFFMSKQLQYNLRKAFDVKQSDRHLLLSQLKLLLNEDIPRIIIKTDITKFYESIPQDRLLSKILNNRILDAKSKKFIKSILEEYEQVKDTSKFKIGCGVPRGIGISAYLSEIYLKELDEKIRSYPGVIYYARYVDDIIIVMHKLNDDVKPNKVHTELSRMFYQEGLQLKQKSDPKTSLLDLSNPTMPNPNPKSMNYLGYRIDVRRTSFNTTTSFGVSTLKEDRIKDRISKSIIYFNTESRYNIKEAKKILLSSLILLCSNMKLTGSKARVKSGIYYSNSLLDNIEEIDRFDSILNAELSNISPYYKLFIDTAAKDRYVNRLKEHITSLINFRRGYDKKRMCNINMCERKKIMRIWK